MVEARVDQVTDQKNEADTSSAEAKQQQDTSEWGITSLNDVANRQT